MGALITDMSGEAYLMGIKEIVRDSQRKRNDVQSDMSVYKANPPASRNGN